MAPDAEKRDPADVIDAVLDDTAVKLWNKAAGGHKAAGLEQGVDLSDAELTLKKWRRAKPAMANA
eukprot:1156044-Pyramimonas_sp.AAC.1